MFTTFELEQDAVVISVPIQEALEFSQSYTPITGSVLLRMQNGAGVKQTHWEKIGTNISCSGIIPPGMTEIDYSRSYILRCGAKRGVTSSSPNIAVPADRRSDTGYEVKGYAFTPDGQGRGDWVETPVTMVVDVAQLTPVAGATLYKAYYWPELTVFSNEPPVDTNVHGAEYSWSLEAEEV